MTRVWSDLATRALQLLPPEQAHALAIVALEQGLVARSDQRWGNLKLQLAGMQLANPLGLAAGFDKDARAVNALLALGFGFVEVGTVTPLAQAGNPRPRLFRLSPDRALINRMGFNNAGLDAFVTRLQARTRRPGVIGANLGANKESRDRVQDYVVGLKRVWAFADYLTINVSSPNTPGLRGLQERSALEELLGEMVQVRQVLTQAHGRRPLFLKVAPDLEDSAIADISAITVAHAVDALIVGNTTLSRPASLVSRHREQAGGLSGRPLRTRSTDVLRSFAQALAGRAALIGVGGVESARDILDKIEAGASAVQLYTAFVYEGPALIPRLLEELSQLLRSEGHSEISTAIGVRASCS